MKKLAVADQNICVACGACMKACPRSAIRIYRGCYAVVEAEQCVGCGLCARACPAACISIRERRAVK